MDSGASDMIELNAVIEGTSSLKAWTRCMHCLCRIGGESIVFSASSQEVCGILYSGKGVLIGV